MPKFELSKPVEGVKVNKRSGIPTGERVSLAFGAILVDPYEERDNLRFSYLGELVEVKLSDIKGYYKPIEAVVAVAAPAAAAAAPAKPVDPRKVIWESIPSSLPTLRAKVPGGWLVAANNGLAFVPDAAHEWDGASL
jgi:hypothetical protein